MLRVRKSLFEVAQLPSSMSRIHFKKITLEKLSDQQTGSAASCPIDAISQMEVVFSLSGNLFKQSKDSFPKGVNIINQMK